MHEKIRKWGTHTTLSQHRYLHLHHDFQHNIIRFAKSLLFTSIRGTLCREDRVSCARPLTNNSQPTVATSHISKVQDDLNVHHTHSTTLPAMTPYTSRGVAPPIFHEWVVAWQATPAQHTEWLNRQTLHFPKRKHVLVMVPSVLCTPHCPPKNSRTRPALCTPHFPQKTAHTHHGRCTPHNLQRQLGPNTESTRPETYAH